MASVIHNHPPYTIEISEEYEISQLKDDWNQIEQIEEVPFFLSWPWVSCWLEIYQPKLIIIKARAEDQLVAIGLLTRSVQKRHGFIKSRQIRLNQTGDPLQDQIWVEYNDFLCITEHRTAAVDASLRSLEKDKTWDEIVISMMPESRANHIVEKHQQSVTDTTHPSYITELYLIRNSGKTYLESLSSNTRYQIKKSIRMLEEEYGSVSLNIANNKNEAIQYFNNAGLFHSLRWTDSGYKNKLFVDFHTNLINSSFDSQNVFLIMISAGSETVAYLYFLRSNSTAFFYLQGVNYGINKRIKPGLLAHALTTQYLMDNGINYYDYMGGYSRYKTQLSQPGINLKTVVIRRKCFKFWIEDKAKYLKNKIYLLLAGKK